MAGVWPFSQRTVELLSRPPAAGETHVWLARAACGLRHALARERCAEFLREVCRRWVSHRPVPEREILAAVALASSSRPSSARKSSKREPMCLFLLMRAPRSCVASPSPGRHVAFDPFS